MARAPVSKTGGWGFESLHSCQYNQRLMAKRFHAKFLNWDWGRTIGYTGRCC
jgi:hypothetical protein